MKLQVIRFRSMVSRKISNVVISISPTIVKNESQLHQQQHQPASASVAGNSNLKVCQFCSKTYRDPKAFARHVATAHPVTNDVKALQSVICDECNHEFQVNFSYLFTFFTIHATGTGNCRRQKKLPAKRHVYLEFVVTFVTNNAL